MGHGLAPVDAISKETRQEGGGSAGTRPGIEIRTVQDNGSVSIRIRDTGMGIAPEQLERIFDFGFSVTDSRVKMGFGLPTAYKIVQEHKGEIKIVSEVGKGTEFIVTLPTEPTIASVEKD